MIMILIMPVRGMYVRVCSGSRERAAVTSASAWARAANSGARGADRLVGDCEVHRRTGRDGRDYD